MFLGIIAKFLGPPQKKEKKKGMHLKWAVRLRTQT